MASTAPLSALLRQVLRQKEARDAIARNLKGVDLALKSFHGLSAKTIVTTSLASIQKLQRGGVKSPTQLHTAARSFLSRRTTV